MAQSRPPSSRVQTTPATTTSTSPPHGEKRHHSRRKSGRSQTDHVTTSEKKSSSRPQTLARKQTPQYVTKVSSSASRQRREEDEDRGRDSGESFPQFCMNCEKQFVPANNTFLYCSESCRIHDHNPPPTPSRTSSFPTPTQSSHTPPLTPYGVHFPSHEDGPDIIPRFSPTQSRPRSYFSSDPYPSSYQAPSILSASVPSQHHREEKKHHSSSSSSSSTRKHTNHGSSSALESLREIAGALPKVSREPARKGSKDSQHSSSSENNSSGVWGYIPFTTPGNSYTQSSSQQFGGNGYGNVSQSQSYTREDVQGYSYAQSGGGYGGMDRPLPPRSAAGLGYRPKSIDLVTPFGGGGH